jgi:hypothetical protein
MCGVEQSRIDMTGATDDMKGRGSPSNENNAKK